MDERIKKYLHDILVSISAIEDFVLDKDFDHYQNNRMLRSAVERELGIIGEAVNRIGKSDPTMVISNSRRIIDARNFVIHSYDKVDDIIIWNIIERNLPALKKEVESISNELS